MIQTEKLKNMKWLAAAILLFSALLSSALQAPAAHIEGAVSVTVDGSKVQNFVAPAVVIDCSSEAAKDADYLLTVDAVKAWEKANGHVPANDVCRRERGVRTYLQPKEPRVKWPGSKTRRCDQQDQHQEMFERPC